MKTLYRLRNRKFAAALLRQHRIELWIDVAKKADLAVVACRRWLDLVVSQPPTTLSDCNQYNPQREYPRSYGSVYQQDTSK